MISVLVSSAVDRGFFYFFYNLRGRLQLTEDSANYVGYCASRSKIYNFTLELRSSQTKDYDIVICCFSANHATLKINLFMP
jgi:hypothetical protein